MQMNAASLESLSACGGGHKGPDRGHAVPGGGPAITAGSCSAPDGGSMVPSEGPAVTAGSGSAPDGVPTMPAQGALRAPQGAGWVFVLANHVG